ncbi:hypothetical protein AUR64_09700 [Haloprofundus marisrubri]|uniref:DUF7847 domain-containing protein n=1 Tax=Haloprofundus marisrubri TaxID=1514971 RepID=A0A0W1R9Z0_9EURY|nr:hypothetical protein [Haloprofundus marisrubri]KTG09890.1 hypothetical protein AUR64_09700 [Haloprofundus marisrubri]
MSVLQSFTQSLRTVLKQPTLFAPATIYALLSLPAIVLPLLGVRFVGPISSLLLVLVSPFFVGGIVGMAREALGGQTSLSTFVAEGKENYLTLLLANVLLFALFFVGFLVFGFAGFAIVILVGVAVPDPTAGVGLGIALFALAAFLIPLLAVLLFQFFFQFYTIAIVVEDAGVVDGFKRSYGVVRSNLLSVFGYTLLVFVLGAVIQLPTFALATVDPLSAYGMVPPQSPVVLGSLVGLAFVSTILVFAFQQTFATAFFLDVRGDVGSAGDSGNAGNAVDAGDTDSTMSPGV